MNARSVFVLVGLAALLATQPGASCVSDTSSDTTGTSSTSSRRDEPLDDRPPSRAEIVKEGRGVLEYTADVDGQYWVEDVREESTIVTGRLHRGETLRVVPDEDRVFIDGSRVSKRDIKRDNTHRVYLLRDRRFDERNGRDRRDDRTDRDGRSGRNDRDDVKVPSGAELLADGKGETLGAWVPRDGKVYVYDADAKRVVATVSARAGDRFAMSGEDDRITINGRRVSSPKLSPRANYRVYLEQR